MVAISTSGNSANIIKAIEKAQNIGVAVIGMTGADGGEMKDIVNVLINVPSDSTPRIQEMHILVGHTMCEIVERSMLVRGI